MALGSVLWMEPCVLPAQGPPGELVARVLVHIEHAKREETAGELSVVAGAELMT